MVGHLPARRIDACALWRDEERAANPVHVLVAHRAHGDSTLVVGGEGLEPDWELFSQHGCVQLSLEQGRFGHAEQTAAASTEWPLMDPGERCDVKVRKEPARIPQPVFVRASASTPSPQVAARERRSAPDHEMPRETRQHDAASRVEQNEMSVCEVQAISALEVHESCLRDLSVSATPHWFLCSASFTGVVQKCSNFSPSPDAQWRTEQRSLAQTQTSPIGQSASLVHGGESRGCSTCGPRELPASLLASG